ncbi:MAG: hypothetical protein B7X54_04335 [Idiomarina sp. 34-48-12]|nr:MAG: hypothetical protein B7X54_04335 [Idiomarina sp. 34-48-12]
MIWRYIGTSIVCIVSLVTGSSQASETSIETFMAAQKVPLPAHYSFIQQRTIQGLPRPLTSSGELLINNDSIHWETKKPIAQSLQITAAGIVDTQSETQIRGGEVIAQLLLAVLAGDLDKINTHFKVTINGECAVLTPQAKPLSQFITHIDTCGSPQLNRIKLYEVNGNNSVIALTPKSPTSVKSD